MGKEIVEKKPNPYIVPGLATSKFPFEFAANILCEELHTSIDELRQKNRKAEIRSKRQICMYMLKWYGNWPLAKIGNFFRLDHATVLHSCRTVENDILTNKELNEFILRMKHTKLSKE